MAYTVKQAFRIRAYPRPAQQRLLHGWFAASRWVWNWSLESRTKAYARRKESVTGVDISRRLTKLKKLPRFAWIAGAPATCLTQTLRRQDMAFAHFFRRVKAGEKPGHPRFKSRHDNDQSLSFQDASPSLWLKGIVSLPKLGRVEIAEPLPASACPDTVTLRRSADGRYHISFAVDAAKELLPASRQSVGIDLGLTHLAVLSTGEKIENPRHLTNRLRYLRQQQRCLSRRVKGSRRREKQRIRVARCHRQVSDARQSALQNLTTRLVRENQTICIEDLNVRGMVRHPTLARHIADAGWGEMRRMLEYKSAWYGRTLVAVDRWYPSSKTCSCCLHKVAEMPLKVRNWTCPACGTNQDRDVNAARNILRAGLDSLGYGERNDLDVDGAVVNAPCEASAGKLSRSGVRNAA